MYVRAAVTFARKIKAVLLLLVYAMTELQQSIIVPFRLRTNFLIRLKVLLFHPKHLSLKVPNVKFDFDASVDRMQILSHIHRKPNIEYARLFY